MQTNQGRHYIVAVAQGNQPPVDVVDMELGKVVSSFAAERTEVRLTISPVKTVPPAHGDFDPR